MTRTKGCWKNYDGKIKENPGAMLTFYCCVSLYTGIMKKSMFQCNEVFLGHSKLFSLQEFVPTSTNSIHSEDNILLNKYSLEDSLLFCSTFSKIGSSNTTLQNVSE